MRTITITFCLTVLAPQIAAGAIVTFQQGVNGYNGTLDVQVKTDDPNGNFDLNILQNDIADNDPSVFWQPLIRFDGIQGSGAGQIPLSGADILSATLTMTVSNGGSGVFVHRVLEQWDESSTFASMGNGVDQFVMTPDDGLGVQSHTKFIADGQVLEFDVTASVEAWIELGNENYGWVLLAPHPNGTDSVSMWSSEHVVISERPILKVEFTQVPEPASWAITSLLFGIGGVWNLGRRHRLCHSFT